VATWALWRSTSRRDRRLCRQGGGIGPAALLLLIQVVETLDKVRQNKNIGLVIAVLFAVISAASAIERSSPIQKTALGQSAEPSASHPLAPSPEGPRENSSISEIDGAPSGSGGSNEDLSQNLLWYFGSKPQHGLRIYLPLISQTIGADSPVGTNAFSRALSRWQGSKGIARTGMLDNDTWEAMRSEFQSHRIKSREYPTPDQLVTAPEADFWDPTRPVELRQVEREAYDAYKRMVAAAAHDLPSVLRADKTGTLAPSEKYLKIISAFRPREYQDQLRKQSPAADRGSLAVNSPHFTGRALDVYVGGKPVSTEDENRLIQTQTPVYKWLVKNALRFGFRPYFYEPWHWEYVP
jgi:D-alanyl-D-alanine carboxypeptidase